MGWFASLALGLLVFGFVYYVYHTAERRGWFVTKATYFTFVSSASGLKVGDPVKLMGFDVGRITDIQGMPPFSGYEVYVAFEVKAPEFDYLWTKGSVAKVGGAGLLASRELEVTKGTSGYPTYTQRPLRDVSIAEAEQLADKTKWRLAQEFPGPQGTNLLGKPWQPLTNLAALAASGYTHIRIMNSAEKRKSLTGVWDPKKLLYEFYGGTNKYWLQEIESPSVTDQAQRLVAQVQAALPGIFALTNQLAQVLSNSSSLTSNLNFIAVTARPVVSNLAAVTAHLDQPGALGEWVFPTNINRELAVALGNANAVLANADTNLTALAEDLGRSLDNLANLTSNLNQQVQLNTNVLSEISTTVIHADEFVQGLKRHWLLRSAFRSKSTNAPPPLPHPLRSPKDKSGL